MKTTDLTPGVVYAMQRRSYGTPTPVAVIDVTRPVSLSRPRYSFLGTTAAYAIDEQSAPSARTYLAVTAANFDDLAKGLPKAAKLTVDALLGPEADVDKKAPKGLSITTIRPRDITSTWADYLEQERNEKEARERAQIAREALEGLQRRQAAAITVALQERGLTAERWRGDVRLHEGSAAMDYAVLLRLLGIDPVE
ncbi:hypothetical protein GCM10025867_49650 (plasmid) [Frondihabitans sucicola]|uniref:Uncharacterized protein n=1 Tax=Frondihabitans sucicola TaxID=1268041 RepID=A0ABM8GWG2_9MICO|nr:hypothetical protein [Frondihabitans sucicola]BDZ52724.1 hypothetical protein GCM10025867_49650 [Frondihabitans sucicola]